MFAVMMAAVGIGLFVASEVMSTEINKTKCGDQTLRQINSAIGNIGVAIASVNITLIMCLEDGQGGPEGEFTKWFMSLLSCLVLGLTIYMKVKLNNACGDIAQKTLWVLIGTSAAGSLVGIVSAVMAIKEYNSDGSDPRKLTLQTGPSEYQAPTHVSAPLVMRHSQESMPVSSKPVASHLSLSPAVSEESFGS